MRALYAQAIAVGQDQDEGPQQRIGGGVPPNGTRGFVLRPGDPDFTVTGQAASILESRIWRTLVKGSGFLLKFVKINYLHPGFICWQQSALSIN
jgi:hypothetical protein